MKRLKLVVIGLAVIFISLAFVLSCENGAVDPTEQDLETLGEAMFYAFDGIEYGVDEPGVTFSGDDPTVPEGMTITFSNYTYLGVTINGSMNIKATVSGTYPYFTAITATVSGTLNFSGPGAPADSVAFNFTISVDFSDPYNPVITVSGTFTIDGTEFNASGIGSMALDFLP